MPRPFELIPLVVFSIVLFLLGEDARAEGLVQVSLRGAVVAEGGAPIEVEVGRRVDDEVLVVELHLHLAQDTSSYELAALLAARLRENGMALDFPTEDSAPRETTHLFLHDPAFVNLRLGHGLGGGVTICEGPLESLRVREPQVTPGGGALRIVATTWHGHTRKLGRARLDLELDADTNAAEVSSALFERGMDAGLVSDRPSQDRWRAAKTAGGAEITGCSISFEPQLPDWRIEVALPEASR